MSHWPVAVNEFTNTWMSTALDAKAAMDAAAAAGSPLPDYIQNLINGQIAAIQAIVPILETQQEPPPDEPPPE